VNRGWVALDNVPSMQEPLEPLLDLTGLIYQPSENRFILGENFSKTLEGQLKIQRMDFKGLSHEFEHDVYPYVLLLDPSAPAGFVRDWQIKTMPPSKHLGYAVQWFALAGTLIFLYLIINLQRKPKK
jgi:surfeit locus 1 family protein